MRLIFAGQVKGGNQELCPLTKKNLSVVVFVLRLLGMGKRGLYSLEMKPASLATGPPTSCSATGKLNSCVSGAGNTSTHIIGSL